VRSKTDWGRLNLTHLPVQQFIQSRTILEVHCKLCLVDKIEEIGHNDDDTNYETRTTRTFKRKL